MFDHLHTIAWVLLSYGGFIVGGLLTAHLMRQNGKDAPHMDDEEKLDRRRLQGGVVFNDILHDMRGDLERLKNELRNEAVEEESLEDRKRARDRAEVVERNIERIARLLKMRSPD